MTVYMEGKVAHLKGDLTFSGMTHSSIEALTVSLRQMDCESDKYIRIDCGKIGEADMSGLQLLYVWMQCARFRGVEPHLINIPEYLRSAMHRMELGHCFHLSDHTRTVITRAFAGTA